eukprot:SAG11_NODE_39589_length_227_cov_122.148438_1_plen_35_part_10
MDMSHNNYSVVLKNIKNPIEKNSYISVNNIDFVSK